MDQNYRFFFYAKNDIYWYYSFSQLLKHYNQAFEQKFQNHNAIFQKAHPFP